MENLWMCFNNLPSIIPLYSAYGHGDMTTFATIGYVSSMSAISHLLENHKHGMPGFFSNRVSYLFNRLDVLGSILTVLRMGYLYYSRYGLRIDILFQKRGLIALLITSFICLKISKYDNMNIALKNRYLLFHSLWHLSIYPIMGEFLNEVIYV